MILNMFRASLCSSSGGQLYIYSIWYRPTADFLAHTYTLTVFKFHQYLVHLVCCLDARSENH
jgi:hypothetical protein